MSKNRINLKGFFIIGLFLLVTVVIFYQFKKQYDMDTINTLAGTTNKKYSEPLNYLFINNINLGKIYSKELCDSFCIDAKKDNVLLDSICVNGDAKETSKFNNVFYNDASVNFCTNKDDTVVSKFKFTSSKNEFKESIIKRIRIVDEEFYTLETKKQKIKNN